jgi:hypothetical protein
LKSRNDNLWRKRSKISTTCLTFISALIDTCPRCWFCGNLHLSCAGDVLQDT